MQSPNHWAYIGKLERPCPIMEMHVPVLNEACWRTRAGCRGDQKQAGWQRRPRWGILGSHWDSIDFWGKLGICPWYPYFFSTCYRQKESGISCYRPSALLFVMWLHGCHKLHYWVPFFRLHLGFLLTFLPSLSLFKCPSLTWFPWYLFLITACRWHSILSPRDT